MADVRRAAVILGTALVWIVLAVAALPARAQEAPVALIKVAEVRRLLDQGARIQLVDVRSYQEYLTRHIKGAISVPLNVLDQRAGEVSRQGLVVFY